MFDYVSKSRIRVPCPIENNCNGYGDRIPIRLYKLQPHIVFRHLEDEIRNCAFRLGITDRPRTKDNRITLATRIVKKIEEDVEE